MDSIINIKCDENINIHRLRYVIDFIDNHRLKPREIKFVLNNSRDSNVIISYSKKESGGLFIPVQNAFFSHQIQNKNYYLNTYRDGDSTVYAVENVRKPENVFVENESYKFDIFETIFFHISRYEEVHATEDKFDFHKRMKSDEQLLFKNNVHHQPVVDLLIFIFFKSLGLDVKQLETTYSLTHDIDIIRKYRNPFSYIKSIAKSVQMGLGIPGMLNIIKSIAKSVRNPENDPYYTYARIFVNNSNFLNKTVYFVAGGNRKYDLYDDFYYKELPAVTKLASEKSYKIGYHPSYDAYNNKELFENEYNRLSKYSPEQITDVRTHYLRLDLQKTFEIIEELGFKTDSTLGYSDDIGFRCGTGFEYYPYNFKEERAWKFKEIPLVFMDSSLIYNVCDDDVECFAKKAKDFFEKNRFNTHIMINFHNSTFDDSLKFRDGLEAFYLELIKMLS